MPTTQTKFKKNNKYILIFVTSFCFSNPCFAYTPCSSDTACVYNSSSSAVPRRICDTCVNYGTDCSVLIKNLLDMYYTSSSSFERLEAYSLLLTLGCYTHSNANGVTCHGTGDFSNCAISLTYGHTDGTWASTNDNCTIHGSAGVPYFGQYCTVEASYDTEVWCSVIPSNISSFSFNGLEFGLGTTTWDHTHARWNINECAGNLYTNSFHDAQAHCTDDVQGKINLTANWDNDGIAKNKIYYARNHPADYWKIKYTQNSSACTHCPWSCEPHYQGIQSTAVGSCHVCVEDLPSCPDGFTGQHYPWQCNVDSNITYTDSTGTFTLSNGSYEADTTGYTSNTTCDLQN